MTHVGRTFRLRRCHVSSTGLATLRQRLLARPACHWEASPYTFDRQDHITAHGTPEGKRWQVMQPATGRVEIPGPGHVLLDATGQEDHPWRPHRDPSQEAGGRHGPADPRADGQAVDAALAYHGDNRVPVEQLARQLSSSSPIAPMRSAWTPSTARQERLRIAGSNEELDVGRYHELAGRQAQARGDRRSARHHRRSPGRPQRACSCPGPSSRLEIAQKFPSQMQAIRARGVADQHGPMQDEEQEEGSPSRERCCRAASIPMPEDFDMTDLRRALRGGRLDLAPSPLDDRKPTGGWSCTTTGS